MFRKLRSTFGILRTIENWPLALQDHAGLVKRRYICRIRNGPCLRLRGGTDDRHIVFEIFVEECYKLARIPPGGIVIDVGAHVGCYSLWAAPSAARVLAYEPWPENLELLRENLALNERSNVAVFSSAVSASPGEATLFIPDEDAFVGRISLYPGRGTRVARAPCVTLDHIIAEEGLDRIDVLKLDCQGAEYETLYGTRPENLARVDQIILECEGFEDRPQWSPQALTAFLQEQGFDVQKRRRLLYAWRPARRR